MSRRQRSTAPAPRWSHVTRHAHKVTITASHLGSDGGGLVAHGDDDEQHLQVEGCHPKHRAGVGRRYAAVGSLGGGRDTGGGGGHDDHLGDIEEWYGADEGAVCHRQGRSCRPAGSFDSDVHACPPSIGAAFQVEPVAGIVAGEQEVLRRGRGCFAGGVARHADAQLACRATGSGDVSTCRCLASAAGASQLGWQVLECVVQHGHYLRKSVQALLA
jgi:hypothetical protein